MLILRITVAGRCPCPVQRLRRKVSSSVGYPIHLGDGCRPNFSFPAFHWITLSGLETVFATSLQFSKACFANSFRTPTRVLSAQLRREAQSPNHGPPCGHTSRSQQEQENLLGQECCIGFAALKEQKKLSTSISLALAALGEN